MSFLFQKRHGWKNFHDHYISVGGVLLEKIFHDKKKFIERIIFYKFGQKRHGWAEICRIVTYFSFLPTMTFFFLNVMVDENLSDFQLIWFFTTMTFFFGKCHFFSKKSWLEIFFKFPRTLNFSRRCKGGQIFHEKKKNRHQKFH